jgi:hypothetical protein
MILYRPVISLVKYLRVDYILRILNGVSIRILYTNLFDIYYIPKVKVAEENLQQQCYFFYFYILERKISSFITYVNELCLWLCRPSQRMDTGLLSLALCLHRFISNSR